MHKMHFMDVAFINVILVSIYLFQQIKNIFHKYTFFFFSPFSSSDLAQRCNSLLLLLLKVGGVNVTDTEQETKNAHSLLKAIRNWNNLE